MKKKIISILTTALFIISVILSTAILSFAAPAPGDDPAPPFCTVRPIAAPVAGLFPASLYRNPYRPNTTTRNGFFQTLTWSPEIEKAFEVNTAYTVTIRLTPDTASNWTGARLPPPANFATHGVAWENIGGLPTENVKSITSEYDGADLLVYIAFAATGPIAAEPDFIFYDDFTGELNPYGRTQGMTTQFIKGPVQKRQEMSYWKNDYSNVVDGQLVLSYARNRTQGIASVGNSQSWLDDEAPRRPATPPLGNNDQLDVLLDVYELTLEEWQDLTPAERLAIWDEFWPVAWATGRGYTRDNFIDSGAVRTRSQSGGDIYFENAYGYYEASIKFPKINAMWGAFWLMYTAPSNDSTASPSSYANRASWSTSEIDIVESCNNPFDNGFNSAFHYGGYGSSHQEVSMEGDENDIDGINIYDGEFHRFGAEWSPTDIVFYIDDIPYASAADIDSHVLGNLWDDLVDGLPEHDGKLGIPQNPNYIKLSVEADYWAGHGVYDDLYPYNCGLGADTGEMVVDYVYVLNGPKPETYAIAPASVEPGNGQVSVNFDIRSANGKGYTVYISDTGDRDSFAPANVNFNSKGAHLKGLTNGKTYYVYIVYESGDVYEKSAVFAITPSK